ncbi:uncharacterized protein LOC100205653 [Hydra vulgaris]|uniref:uncharacterized protein LOC100205653 n=1 Tax=Hydra vulgaris TaxID=6087 RepID=UPI00019250AE|nr:uncharacterized protein LOC100205653 [Hydra vulgaris]
MATPDIDIWNLTSDICYYCRNGEYDKCACRTESVMGTIYHSHGDLSSDSLDECVDQHFQANLTCTAKTYQSSFNNQYITDDAFKNRFLNERMLPPSETDWRIVDSLLKKYIDVDETNEKKVTTQYSLKKASSIQMVFVDSDESEIEDTSHYSEIEPMNSIKYVCLESERNTASCDSGYVAGDLEYNNDLTSDPIRKNSLETSEVSKHLLATLNKYDEHDGKLDDGLLSNIRNKKVEELRSIKEFLEIRISQINSELVDELLVRDELYLRHESLLMDADDLAKTCKKDDEVMLKQDDSSKHLYQTQSNLDRTVISPRSKIKFFWKR